MSHSLAMAIRLEKSGDSVKYPAYPYMVEEDEKAIGDKLAALTSMVEGYEPDSADRNLLQNCSLNLHMCCIALKIWMKKDLLTAPDFGLRCFLLWTAFSRNRKIRERMRMYHLTLASWNRVLFLTLHDDLPARLQTASTYPALLLKLKPYCPLNGTNQLALVDVKSTSHLRDLGRRLEAKKEAVDNYVLPSRRSGILEPALAYLEVSSVDSIQAPSSSSNRRGVDGTVQPAVVCFRCSQPGLKAVGCLLKRDRFCYRCKKEGVTVRTCPIVLDHVEDDERPYLRVEVLGKEVLGLLDSGASRTVLGSKGLRLIEELGLVVDRSKTSLCSVANGNRCRSAGVVQLPLTLRSRLRLMEKLMELVPDLRHDEWHFSKEPILINEVGHVKNQTLLSHLENTRLQAVIDRNVALMGKDLGCTDKAEHVIETNSPPIKQRYYRDNPVVQAQIDKELEEMLRIGVRTL
ncbi:hypothetical protein JTB14_036020 [Gonioctena quinquepunctata]|nr:hypothetical protein JTB14_036020 [Gonioctena quinquepunctata]